jgi:hypothetical protein
MEDWRVIAAEVSDAIRSVSDVSQPNGYPVTLRIPGTVSGPEWDPVVSPPTYGTLIGQTRHTLTVTADPDVVPLKSHTVAIGIAAEDASEGSAWLELLEVRPLAPAGVAVLYDIDLVI